LPIPKCPNCKKFLWTVRIEEHDTLDWDSTEQAYKSGGQGKGVCVCANCGKEIGGYGQLNWGFYPEVSDS